MNTKNKLKWQTEEDCKKRKPRSKCEKIKERKKEQSVPNQSIRNPKTVTKIRSHTANLLRQFLRKRTVNWTLPKMHFYLSTEEYYVSFIFFLALE